jgi:hypothetical protein
MDIHPSPSSSRESTLEPSVAALRVAVDEPSHIHIPRPSRARQPGVTLELEPEPAIDILSEFVPEQAA